MSAIVKLGKKIKKLLPPPPVFISYSRRINCIKTNKRICAMTFDDGPMLLPASPDNFDGKPLTEILLDSLDKFGAKGTFDIIGTTSFNYPDKAGMLGSASWGGIKFDHYPDINMDNHGGALCSDEYIKRMIKDGHTLSNHGYRHIIFGKKPFVYGDRVHLDGIDRVIADTKELNDFILNKYNYKISFGRPPHYVDKIKGGYSSYDAYSYLGMNYLGASFDGGGWLPLSSAEEEVTAMLVPLKNTLEKDPDSLCGKIIFQKDGYNMAKRTPVAYALEKQLELLYNYGYTVTGVDKLMEESRFSDVFRDDPIYEKLCLLSDKAPIVFSDNCLYLDKPMTNGEFALLMSPPDISASPLKAKEMMEIAIKTTFIKHVSPSATLTTDTIKSFSDRFVKLPDSVSRRSVFECILLN